MFSKCATNIVCPLGVERGTDYECVFYVTAGSEIDNFAIERTGANTISVTDVAGM